MEGSSVVKEQTPKCVVAVLRGPDVKRTLPVQLNSDNRGDELGLRRMLFNIGTPRGGLKITRETLTAQA